MIAVEGRGGLGCRELLELASYHRSPPRDPNTRSNCDRYNARKEGGHGMDVDLSDVESLLRAILHELKAIHEAIDSELDWSKQHSFANQVIERLDAIAS